VVISAADILPSTAFAAEPKPYPVQACVLVSTADLTDAARQQYAQCLGWQPEPDAPVCYGSYTPLAVKPLDHPEAVHLTADKVSFYPDKPSVLKGNVEVRQQQRVINAQTAYVYRDKQTSKVNRIKLLGQVRYLEPGRLMIARRAVINPQDKSGLVEDAIYRFNNYKHAAILPAWGRATLIQRFANKDYLLRKATYSHCAPQDKSWEIQAEKITLDDSESKGVARNAVLRIKNVPVLYTPYISFPTSSERKSGFLMPVTGYSNVGGYDLALPYYWNIAANADATLIPHAYTRRGVMMGGQFRYLTENTKGVLEGNFLPDDRAFKTFLHNHSTQFPFLRDESVNRWSFGLHQSTFFTPNLYSNINVQQVSDDYFLQDFSTNLAVVTERQLLRQADVIYHSAHWIFSAMAQSYQTLNPVNASPVEGIYERLPQLKTRGLYNQLPLNANFSILGQYDQFHWAGEPVTRPEGPRLHLNPALSFPQIRPWGFITPSFEVVENYYDVNRGQGHSVDFNRTIPRYNLDSGLFFERSLTFLGHPFVQTLEPRLYYLYVPFKDQTQIPVYDSAFMIFNIDQLYRNNRFSGFDRIGDANQLTYSITTRLLSDKTGAERASFSIGQIHYFERRRVQLCQSISGSCLDNPDMLGFLSPVSESSPIVSRLMYHLSPSWIATGDYVWDPASQATNNGHLNFHYQPAENHIVNLSYTYLVNGDKTGIFDNQAGNSALHQATAAYAWSINDNWSSLGAYGYNLSKGYDMLSFLGLQYDSCCWALRLMGGRTFTNIDSNNQPHYNNNIYLQVLLKGLGSVASSDPYSTVNTYIPGYNDQFHR